MPIVPAERRPMLGAGLLLGAGLGGFVDGIVFHQILQTHSMLSARRPQVTVENIKVSMVWDGLFHAGVWTLTAVGLAALYRVGRRAADGEPRAWSGRALVGGMLAGWGLFNLVEGVIDHHVLHIHHVVEARGVSVYDWAFLASGIVLGCIGTAIARSGSGAAGFAVAGRR